MSTSCIICIKSEADGVIFLEKTHDGYFETVKFLINTAISEVDLDAELIANYLIKNTDVRFSIYSHKYPSEMFIFDVDKNTFTAVEINPYGLNKISECIKYIEGEKC